jgi:hypothetical protein
MGLITCEECAGKVSDKAVMCPHCGAPGKAWKEHFPAALQGRPPWPMGYEYRSEATFFGWPLVHVATGIDPTTGRKRVARGVIAIGDIAIGGLALGGVALGGLTLGGLSLGLFALGGLAVGLLIATGGMAIGSIALGGFAAGYVAIGGGAFGYYALGGGGYGVHALTGDARDPEAVRFFTQWFGSGIEQMARGRLGR